MNGCLNVTPTILSVNGLLSHLICMTYSCGNWKEIVDRKNYGNLHGLCGRILYGQCFVCEISGSHGGKYEI
jgi:hypothetical protein